MTRTIALLFIIILGVHALSETTPPSSQRAKKAIKAVKPKLVEALNSHDATWGVAVFIRIFKYEKKLELWVAGKDEYQLFRTYNICTYSGELGPKLKEGDLQAPEGFYRVTAKLMNPWSSFHLSFNVGYPNEYDQYHKRTGSYIMVHGSCVSTGCFAMTDEKIEEIYAMVDAALRHGQKEVPVHIFPFKINDALVKLLGEPKLLHFWENLREGYDYFEEHHKPPNVKIRKGKYVFEKPSF